MVIFKRVARDCEFYLVGAEYFCVSTKIIELFSQMGLIYLKAFLFFHDLLLNSFRQTKVAFSVDLIVPHGRGKIS